MPKEGTDPDDIDYTGIQTTSTFHGRAFLRNGVVGTSTHTYATNYLFDSVSTQFTGVGKTFTVTQDDVNVEGFSSSHALILINEIAQIPSQGSRVNDFELVENAGITSVVFSGFAASVTNDVNTGSVPVGGVLVSVGSTQGFTINLWLRLVALLMFLDLAPFLPSVSAIVDLVIEQESQP